MDVETVPASVLRSLLHPDRLYSGAALDRPSGLSPIPKQAGVYTWYFAQVPPPGVPTEGCHQALGHTLLYVGIAPRETRSPGVKTSRRTLYGRFRDHFRGNAEGSPLRLTLECLLAEPLGIELRRVGSGNRLTLAIPGEQRLDAWMAETLNTISPYSGAR